MPSPPIRFDVSPIIELALAQSAAIEKRELCEGCQEERRRLLVYAFESAAPALGFEVVRLKEERAMLVTNEQLRNGNRMRQALKWIFHAVEKNVKAVPRKGPGELPPYDIVVMDKPNGGTAQDVIDAVERNAAALAVLLPTEHVAVVTVADLRVLLKIAELSGAPTQTVAELHDKGLSLLDGWAYQRGREIDDRKMRDLPSGEP